MGRTRTFADRMHAWRDVLTLLASSSCGALAHVSATAIAPTVALLSGSVRSIAQARYIMSAAAHK